MGTLALLPPFVSIAIAIVFIRKKNIDEQDV